MPRQRFFRLAPEARERLLGVAAAHFSKRGFDGASLNEILAEAGISKGSYYYYFDDKEDLFASVLDGAVDEVLAQGGVPSFDGIAPAEFWAAVEAYVVHWAAAFDRWTDLVKVAMQLTEAQRRSPSFAPLLAKAQGFYRSIIEPGRRLGCVRTDLAVDVLVRLLEANDAVLDGLFLAEGADLSRARVRRHTRLVFDTFKRLLVADPFDAHARRPSAVGRPGGGLPEKRRSAKRTRRG